MLFSTYGQAVLTLHQRHSRLLLAARPASKAAGLIAYALADMLADLPLSLRKTLIFDNGTEFARHTRLHTLALQAFFRGPHALWQKGGIENAIGRIRRFLPRKTDLILLPNKRFHALLTAYNNASSEIS